MRKLLLALTSVLLAIGANAQIIGVRNRVLFSYIRYGEQTSNTTASAGNQNIQLFTPFQTGAATYTVNSCSVPIAANGTAGDHIECGIYAGTVTGGLVHPTTALCHAAYTETGSEGASVITIPLTGCGTLTASTAYMVFVNTNDAAVQYRFTTCGGSCSGTYPASTTPSQYAAGTYGTYPSSPSVTNAGVRFTEWVTVH